VGFPASSSCTDVSERWRTVGAGRVGELARDECRDEWRELFREFDELEWRELTRDRLTRFVSDREAFFRGR
jgi:hypothetical protein